MQWLDAQNPRRTVVIGASGGIGRAFVRQLYAQNQDVWALSRRPINGLEPDINQMTIDLEDEASIAAAAKTIDGEIDLVIIATGILSDGNALQPEKTWRHLDGDAMTRVYRINTIGPALCAKHFLAKLPRKRKAVFAALSARVGSITDNGLGGWHSYRASKAALNMILKTCSIELRIRCPQAAIIGLHPGTVDTELSEPFQGNVKPEKLFKPDEAASMMLEVIDGVDADQTGRIFDYAGKVIPY